MIYSPGFFSIMLYVASTDRGKIIYMLFNGKVVYAESLLVLSWNNSYFCVLAFTSIYATERKARPGYMYY